MLNETPLRRSQLGIPGNEPRLITAAMEGAADEIFLDLEDSVAPGEKQSARSDLIDVVETQQCDEMVLSHRTNGTDTRWWYNDVIEVVDAVGEGIDTLTVPKVRGPSDVQAVTTLLEAGDQRGDRYWIDRSPDRLRPRSTPGSSSDDSECCHTIEYYARIPQYIH